MLPPKESALLLLSRISDSKPKDEALAIEIACRLGGLPLAINHIASYIQGNRFPLAEFIQIYDEDQSTVVDARLDPGSRSSRRAFNATFEEWNLRG